MIKKCSSTTEQTHTHRIERRGTSSLCVSVWWVWQTVALNQWLGESFEFPHGTAKLFVQYVQLLLLFCFTFQWMNNMHTLSNSLKQIYWHQNIYIVINHYFSAWLTNTETPLWKQLFCNNNTFNTSNVIYKFLTRISITINIFKRKIILGDYLCVFRRIVRLLNYRCYNIHTLPIHLIILKLIPLIRS